MKLIQENKPRTLQEKDDNWIAVRLLYKMHLMAELTKKQF